MTKLIVAIDTSNIQRAWRLVGVLRPYADMFKFGSQFFTAFGPLGIVSLRVPHMLDLKFHDTPDTVGKAVRAAAAPICRVITIHAAGGSEMIRAACEVVQSMGEPRPLIAAVTVLTSLQSDNSEVLHLAALAVESGADALVCSAHEVAFLRVEYPRTKIIVPGIRPPDVFANDHQRVGTAREAARAGADWIVVGRPITEATDPADAAKRMLEEMS